MIKRIKKKYIFIVMCAVVTVLGVIITAINLMSYSSVNSQVDEKLKMLIQNEGLMPDFPIQEDPEDEEPEDDEGNTPDEDKSENQDDENPNGDGKTDDTGSGSTGTKNDDLTDGDSASGEEKDKDSDDQTDSEDKTDKGNKNDKNNKDEKEEEEDVRQHMSPETPFETRFFSVKFNTDGVVAAVDTSKIAAVDEAKARAYAEELLAASRDGGYIDSYKFKRGVTQDGGIIYVFIDVNRELKSMRSFLVSSLVISALGIITVFVIVLLLSDVALKPIIESYEKQKRFITDAGHEMKTPLTVISANAEIIEMENGESPWITGIKSQVSKLAALTEKLVILSKMEEGAKLEMKEFSLSEAFYDTCDQYQSIAMSAGISFNVSASENVSVVGSEGEIRRCIGLLLDNAFRYSNEGGFVSASVQKLPNGAELRFTNSTDGIEKGSLDRWFDRFYRTDLSRNSDTGGSGIGLSVVHAIVLAHGGTVRAFSEDGINVVFVINL